MQKYIFPQATDALKQLIEICQQRYDNTSDSNNMKEADRQDILKGKRLLELYVHFLPVYQNDRFSFVFEPEKKRMYIINSATADSTWTSLKEIKLMLARKGLAAKSVDQTVASLKEYLNKETEEDLNSMWDYLIFSKPRRTDYFTFTSFDIYLGGAL